MNDSDMVPTNTINLHEVIMPVRNAPIHSDKLFVHGNVVFIHHQDEQYRLQRTRNGKLILTK